MPLLLYAYAAKTLATAVLSILNATSPVWATLIGTLALRQALDRRTGIGLALGIIGVGTVVGVQSQGFAPGVRIAIGVCLLAALSYGVAALYAKRAGPVDSFSSALGSMWAASLLVLPLTVASHPAAIPANDILGGVLALGVVCTGFAFLLYFRLVRDVGAGAALTVTFLIPLFGIAWGGVFLGERIGWNTVAGTVLVIAGTALVARAGRPSRPAPRAGEAAAAPSRG